MSMFTSTLVVPRRANGPSSSSKTRRFEDLGKPRNRGNYMNLCNYKYIIIYYSCLFEQSMASNYPWSPPICSSFYFFLLSQNQGWDGMRDFFPSEKSHEKSCYQKNLEDFPPRETPKSWRFFTAIHHCHRRSYFPNGCQVTSSKQLGCQVPCLPSKVLVLQVWRPGGRSR